MPWDMWDLDHTDIPHIVSGDIPNPKVRPAHRSCNRRAGKELGLAIRRAGIESLKAGLADDDKELNSEFENKNSEFNLGKNDDAFSDDASSSQHYSAGRNRPPISGISGNSPAHSGIPPIPAPFPGISPNHSAALGNGGRGIADIRPDQGISTPAPDSVVWTRAPWLRPWLDVPANAAWPRLMSRPHPDAAGSYGPEAVTWLEAETGMHLRWWQAVAVVRALEHDDAGALVWPGVVLSTARQVGKSWLVRALALWRLCHGDLFGEPQLILHTGKDLNVCREVHRPARVWAAARGWPIRETNGQEEITRPDDESRWIVRGSKSVYGYAASMAIADETWDMAARLIDDGIEPTMMERASAQLVLLSTAHSRATSLMLGRRMAALEAWETPADTLLLEWSAPAGTPLEDTDAWRQASPYWSRGRQRLLEARYRRVVAGVHDPDDVEDNPEASFSSQVLNVWPRQRAAGAGRDEPLTSADGWAMCADLTATAPAGPVIVAIEDWYGLGAAACVAAKLPGDRILIWGDTFNDRAEALTWADVELHSREDRAGSVLIVGASLNPPAVAEALATECHAAGAAHTRTGLPTLRALIASRQIVHGGDKALTAQVTGCRVASRDGGLVPVHRGVRSDLVRAASWAVMAATRPAAAPLPFFVY